jgi:hypothetical protein
VIFHLAQSPIFLLHERPGVLEKSFTSCRQAYLPRVPLKNLNAKLPLQDLNPKGERGLSEIEADGRTAEMPFICDCQKRP